MPSTGNSLPFSGRVSDSVIRHYFLLHQGSMYDAASTSAEPLATIEQVEELISRFVGRTFISKALGAEFKIDERTRNHILGVDKSKGRNANDVLRRGRIFLSGLGIAQHSDQLLAVDRATDHHKGIVYYEFIGHDSRQNPGKIIVVKLSEHESTGKILWSMIEMKQLPSQQ